MTFSVEAALDAYILATEEPRPFDGKWHPSSISGCRRKAIYEIRETPHEYEQTPQQRRIFRIGHVWHAFFQKAVAMFSGLHAVYTEVKVLGESLDVAGAGDQVVMFTPDDGELQEFKTKGEWAFNRLTEPDADHIKQVKPYFVLLREFGGVDENGVVVPPLGDKLKRVRITYIEKQRLSIKEFVLEWDPAWADEVRAEIALLNQYREDPISLPPRLPVGDKGKKHWMCENRTSTCPFFDRCWNKDPKERPADPDIY